MNHNISHKNDGSADTNTQASGATRTQVEVLASASSSTAHGVGAAPTETNVNQVYADNNVAASAINKSFHIPVHVISLHETNDPQSISNRNERAAQVGGAYLRKSNQSPRKAK